MNREEFYARLAGLDEPALRKALWNVYWRATENVRERIEQEIAPQPPEERPDKARAEVDPAVVLADLRSFVALAKSGAYMGGDRRVSKKERSRWRFTFRRHVARVEEALNAGNPGFGIAAMEELIDFACELRAYEYFHSDDPVEAAKFVASDAVAMLWTRVLETEGFPAFAALAAPQLVRWELRYGWTRRGFGPTSAKETSLASVLERMLRHPDAWTTFTDRYLEALDEAAGGDDTTPKRSWERPSRDREDRADNLSAWHFLLLEKLMNTEAEDRLDRLVAHPGLAGPELAYVQAKLAHRRGELESARSLIEQSLVKLPGHQGFLKFALEIGATLPARAREVVRMRSE